MSSVFSLESHTKCADETETHCLNAPGSHFEALFFGSEFVEERVSERLRGRDAMLRIVLQHSLNQVKQLSVLFSFRHQVPLKKKVQTVTQRLRSVAQIFLLLL